MKNTFKVMIVACAALAMSGCVSPAFRTATNDFAVATKATALQQKSDLDAIVKEEDERLRTLWAKERLRLSIDPKCARLINGDLILDAGPNAVVSETRPVDLCRIGKIGRDGELLPLEKAPNFGNIAKLNSALVNYADNLVLLSEDMGKDKAALAKVLSDTGSSIVALDAAVRDTLKIEGKDEALKNLTPIGNIIGELAGIYFELKRKSALKRIILTGEPLVEAATNHLDQVAGLVIQKKRADALEELDDASNKLALLIGNGSVSQIRLAQNELFEKHAKFLNLANSGPLFKQISNAHRKLAIYATKGATKDDLREAIKEIFRLVSSVDASVQTINQGGD